MGIDSVKSRRACLTRAGGRCSEKLTEGQARAIRASAKPQDELAADFGIGQSTVSRSRVGTGRSPKGWVNQLPVSELRSPRCSHPNGLALCLVFARLISCPMH
jgi:hypothetical protein